MSHDDEQVSWDDIVRSTRQLPNTEFWMDIVNQGHRHDCDCHQHTVGFNMGTDTSVTVTNILLDFEGRHSAANAFKDQLLSRPRSSHLLFLSSSNKAVFSHSHAWKENVAWSGAPRLYLGHGWHFKVLETTTMQHSPNNRRARKDATSGKSKRNKRLKAGTMALASKQKSLPNTNRRGGILQFSTIAIDPPTWRLQKSLKNEPDALSKTVNFSPSLSNPYKRSKYRQKIKTRRCSRICTGDST